MFPKIKLNLYENKFKYKNLNQYIMKKLAISIIIIIIVSKSVFSQNCQAWFWQSPDSLNSILIHFYPDCVPQNEIISYQWDFGDGSTSNQQFPVYLYSMPGNYAVSLTINTLNCSNSVINNVDVYSSVVSSYAGFYYKVSGFDFLTVSFFDNSFIYNTVANSWSWDFGDGFTSTEQNPVHVYSQSGIYNVKLKLTLATTVSVFESQVFVGTNYNNGNDCISMFSFEQTSPGGHTFQFWDASWLAGDTIVSQLWDFGNGAFSIQNNPVYTYPNSGEYVVNHTINTNTCTSSQQSIVYAGDSVWYPKSCQALFWVESNPNNAYEINFFDYSYVLGNIQYWEWNFGDNTEFAYSQNPVHTYLQDGIYTSSLHIVSDSCESVIEFQIQIPFQNNITNNCNSVFYAEMANDTVTFYDLSTGNPQTWNWNFGDGTVSMLQNPSHIYDELGIHEIALLIGGNGCNNNSGMVLDLSTAQISYMFVPEPPTNIVDNSENKIIVFPNPLVDKLNINNQNNEIVLAQIVDITGKLLISKTIKISDKNISIDISNIPKGVYILKIIFSNQTIGTYKIVKS